MHTVLVTGAGRNIGRDIAEAFARRGDRVVLNARSPEQVGAAAETLQQEGAQARAITGDVADGEAVRRIVTEAEEHFGPVDILVHCAAVRVHRPFLQMSKDEWDLPLAVGLDAAFHCAQATLPGMIEKGWGRIVSLAGVTGQTGAANRAAVVTAKSGLIGFTKALAREFAGTGVTVNAVSPGMIATHRGEWTSLGDANVTAAHYEERAKTIPVGRMGGLDEVTAACLYLCSDNASFVTGQTLNVNGGLYMG